MKNPSEPIREPSAPSEQLDPHKDEEHPDESWADSGESGDWGNQGSWGTFSNRPNPHRDEGSKKGEERK